jgi:hypothetical protein
MRSDHALARRIERAEGAANARFVEARARVMPEVGATWIEVAGTYAMFDGPQSPCTQTFGLGMFSPASPADLHRIENFFHDRGAATQHEVCPLADKALLTILNERGYHPVELSNVLLMKVDGNVGTDPGAVGARIAREDELDVWASTAAAGWSDINGFSDQIAGIMRVSAARESFVCFFAEQEGRPIATGALAIHEGVALLAGASTVPEFRRRGAQRALFTGRLRYAAQAGCDLAVVISEPGSATQRNAERHGFHVAYTRTKWMKD